MHNETFEMIVIKNSSEMRIQHADIDAADDDGNAKSCETGDDHADIVAIDIDGAVKAARRGLITLTLTLPWTLAQ